MIRTVVSGCNGFIGKHLVECLHHLGHKVVSLDREGGNSSVTKADYVFDLAAYGNRYDQKDINETYKANVERVKDLLLWTSPKNKAVILTGTSSEYGRKTKPMKETDALEPETYYAASKVAATKLGQVWATRENVPVVTVRPFSLYGPGEGDHKFIPILARSMFANKIVDIAPGVHDWIHIDDYIDALIFIMNRADFLKGEVINVGTGIQSTNTQVAKLFKKVTGHSIKTRKVGKLIDYDTTKSWVADITKIKNLGWKPKITLEEGIKRTYEWYMPI